MLPDCRKSLVARQEGTNSVQGVPCCGPPHTRSVSVCHSAPVCVCVCVSVSVRDVRLLCPIAFLNTGMNLCIMYLSSSAFPCRLLLDSVPKQKRSQGKNTDVCVCEIVGMCFW